MTSDQYQKSRHYFFAENYSTMFIGFIGIMLIARLLVPAEIGIYSVASAVTSIAQMMRDTGVGNYLIQECGANQGKNSNILNDCHYHQLDSKGDYCISLVRGQPIFIMNPGLLIW